HRLIAAAGYCVLTIGREGDAVHRVRVSDQAIDFLAAGDLPHADDPVAPAGQGMASVGSDGDAENLAAVAGKRLDLLAVAQVPEVQIEVRSRRPGFALPRAGTGQQGATAARREGRGSDTAGKTLP